MHEGETNRRLRGGEGVWKVEVEDKLADRYDLEDRRKDAAADKGGEGLLKRSLILDIIINNFITSIIININMQQDHVHQHFLLHQIRSSKFFTN